jgi:hypothetical protein
MVIQQELVTLIQQVRIESKLTDKTAAIKNVSGPYRSYSSVSNTIIARPCLEQGMFAR